MKFVSAIFFIHLIAFEFLAFDLLAKVNCFWCHVQVPEGKIEERDGDFSEVAKKIRAKARLTKIGSIPLSELGKLKAYLLNTKSDGQFSQNGNIVEIGKLCTKVLFLLIAM